MNDPDSDGQSNAIAIIGMAGRFPGAIDVDALWQVSTRPGDTLRHFSAEDLRPFEPDPAAVESAENYVRVRGILENVEDFDADFFGVSPGDAALLDPQHRLWLEVAWHALESAGYARDDHGQVVGVYTGTFPSTYLHYCLLRSRADVEEFVRMRRARSFAQMVNNDPAFLPTRTANRFNLRGPAINVQTACSTSLVAIGMGVQSLLSYESDIVLAGGVCVTVPQKTGYFYQEGAIYSRDGTCRPYDAKACGTVFGNGAGAVVLRRLRDALDAGDTVLATIRGIAINNDGSNKVSYVAPSVRGQSEVIVAALELADFSADTVGYVEGHGTATPMGDPIEVEALCAAYRESSQRKEYCCLGSIKGSVGHLDAAAGVTGLIHAVQALRYQVLPSTAHFVEPNPELRLTDSPFFVLATPKAWDVPEGHPRRAAVSSFGIGGTNVHAVLEEAPVQDSNPGSPLTNGVALLLSGASSAALDAATAELKTWFERDQSTQPQQWSLRDVAYTLAHRRRHFVHRRVVRVADRNDAIQALGERSRWETGRSPVAKREVVFAFPGQGSLRPGAVAAILRHSPEFAQELASYCAETTEFVDLDLYAWFQNPQASLSELTSGRPALQLAVFCFGAALAAWLKAKGIVPAICVGHSLGEWTAAHVCGVFSRADAVRAIAARDHWMHSTGPGSGLIVSAAAAEVIPHLGRETWIVCHNSPLHCMVGGRPGPVRDVAERLKAFGIGCRLTDIDVAVHTVHMDEAVAAFRSALAGVSMSPPRTALVSTVTGSRLSDEEAVSVEYWAMQLREPVRFDLACQTVVASQSAKLVVELGMGSALRFLFGVMSQEAKETDTIAIPGSLPEAPAGYSPDSLARAELALWANGLALPADAAPQSGRTVFGLPGYPFQRKRYWVDPPELQAFSATGSSDESGGRSVDSPGTPAANRTVLESILAAISQQARVESRTIDSTKSFHDLGFDSLFLVQLAERLSTELGASVGLRLLMEHNSVGRLAAEMESRVPKGPILDPMQEPCQSTTQANLSFRGLHVVQQGDGKLPLFVIHGDVLTDALPKYLDSNQTVVGYLHQGADGNEIKLTTVEDLTRNCVAEWLSAFGRRSVVIAGHSYGGMIAFQVCHELAKMGIEVPLLVLLDPQHPTVFRPNPLSSLRSFSRWRYLVAEHWEAAIDIRKARRALKTIGRVPVEMRTAYTLATYDLAIRDYQPPTVECDALLFRATENYAEFPDNGWSRGIKGDLDVIAVPGDHLSVVRDPRDLEIVGAELAIRLSAMRQRFFGAIPPGATEPVAREHATKMTQRF